MLATRQRRGTKESFDSYSVFSNASMPWKQSTRQNAMESHIEIDLQPGMDLCGNGTRNLDSQTNARPDQLRKEITMRHKFLPESRLTNWSGWTGARRQARLWVSTAPGSAIYMQPIRSSQHHHIGVVRSPQSFDEQPTNSRHGILDKMPDLHE